MVKRVVFWPALSTGRLVVVGVEYDVKEGLVHVFGGGDFEVRHGGGVGKGNTLVAAQDDNRGAFVAFAHQKNRHASEWVNKIDLREMHEATEEIWFATDVPEWLDAGETKGDTGSAPAQGRSVRIGGDDTEAL